MKENRGIKIACLTTDENLSAFTSIIKCNKNQNMKTNLSTGTATLLLT